MFILNQIVGVGGFSIADNLRLIVIAAIFIGITVVLLYRRFAKNWRETNGEYISKEKTIKEKTGEAIEDLEDIIESAEGTEEKPVVDFETIEEKIKNSEAEIITKFAAEIEGLISKIEERGKEVVDKIENLIDAKVQEAFKMMNDKVSDVLYTQKNSTASALEKLVDSLRTEDSLTSEKTEKVVEEKVGLEKVEERDLETPVKDQGILEELASSLRINEGPVGVSSSDESKAVVEEALVSEGIKEDELELPSEDSADVRLAAKEPIASPEKNEEKVPEKAVGDTADFDMQAFLDEESVGISLPDESGSSEEMAELPEEIKEEELAVPSEDKVDIKSEAKEPIASPGEIEEKVSVEAEGDSADFDIQEFLDELENLPSEKDPEGEK